MSESATDLLMLSAICLIWVLVFFWGFIFPDRSARARLQTSIKKPAPVVTQDAGSSLVGGVNSPATHSTALPPALCALVVGQGAWVLSVLLGYSAWQNAPVYRCASGRVGTAGDLIRMLARYTDPQATDLHIILHEAELTERAKVAG